VAFTEVKQDKESLELFMLTFDKLKGFAARRNLEATQSASADSPIAIISGVCLKKDELRMKLTLMRITKGNAIV